ncbi:hypothetical protein [Brevundimonas aurifodinae]|uniref:Uncharacterized protein n=1 Tax=Brevundimonas aurifodinae TaxID=1508312 RepID=A0ABV1NL49_9CAUL
MGLLATLEDMISAGFSGRGFPHGHRGRTLALLADFSGAHRCALYSTYAFLLLDMDRNQQWLADQRAFRQQFLLDGRRLSFKALNDRNRRAAMPQFLNMAGDIEGALVVFAIDKSHASLFQPFAADADLSALGPWKPSVHEHLMRVTHLSALCLAAFSRPHQDVLWVCDQDDIASNDNQIIALTPVVAQVTAAMLRHPMGHIKVGNTGSDDGSLALEDLTAIPDLLAGAVCEGLSLMRRQNRLPVQGLQIAMPVGLSTKSGALLAWMSQEQRSLRTQLIAIDATAAGRSMARHMKLAPLPRFIRQV